MLGLGSRKNQVRVKKGYVPPDEQPKYVPPVVQQETKRQQQQQPVPGADPGDAVPRPMMSKAALKNEKRKAARAKEKEGNPVEEEIDKVAQLAAAIGMAPKVAAPAVMSKTEPTPPPPPAPQVDAAPPPATNEKEPNEVEKKVRALRKKLRAVDDLIAKQASGAELNADQLSKVAARGELQAEISRWETLGDPEELSKDEVTQFFKMLAEVDQICKDHGLVQVVHPHLQTVVETKKDIDMVVDNSEVMWCLDTGHMTIGGQDTVEFAKKYASRVGHVHLKDVNMKSVPPVLARQQSIMEGVQKGLFTPLGQGDVPILDTILALEAAGYQGWYVIEQDVAITGEMPGLGEGPISGMKQSVDYLHNVVAPALAKIGK